MKSQSKIQRISSRLHLVFSIFLILVPAFTAGFWLFYNQLPQTLVSVSTGLPANLYEAGAPDASQRGLGFLVSLLPLAAKVLAMVSIMRLLTLYRGGCIFSADHVRHFKRLGQTLIFYGIAGVLETTGLGLVMTMRNPPGQHILTIGVNSDNISIFVIAAIVLMLAWVMDEGRKQAEEQALTV